jgi:5-methylcytosine-specific restriction endonuclease McrA
VQSKRTQSLNINRATRQAVFERDNGCCVLCGRPGNPEAHYISRAHGGLGIEQNIVTLCRSCHRRYDQTTERAALGAIIADYLRTQYHDWTPTELIYRKE